MRFGFVGHRDPIEADLEVDPEDYAGQTLYQTRNELEELLKAIHGNSVRFCNTTLLWAADKIHQANGVPGR